jgi:hypothetical protein
MWCDALLRLWCTMPTLVIESYVGGICLSAGPVFVSGGILPFSRHPAFHPGDGLFCSSNWPVESAVAVCDSSAAGGKHKDWKYDRAL